MLEDRIRVAPNTVAYADRENHKLVVEFAIPGAPTDTIDVKILEDSIHLTAPARDIEYVSGLCPSIRQGYPATWRPEGAVFRRFSAGRGRSGSRSSSQENTSLCFAPNNRSAAVVPSARLTR